MLQERLAFHPLKKKNRIPNVIPKKRDGPNKCHLQFLALQNPVWSSCLLWDTSLKLQGKLHQELVTYMLSWKPVMILLLLKQGFQTAMQTGRFFFVGDWRRSELTGLPLGLHIQVYAIVWRRCSFFGGLHFLKALDPTSVSSLGYCPCAEATSLCQIPSLLYAVNNFCKEDPKRATVQAAIITAAWKANMQIRLATVFSSTSYRLNSLWS